MIEFKTLTIKNFLSYGAIPTVIPLEEPGTTLILGEDLDNTASGTGANGVGKTVILNALAYAVYDKPISDIPKDALVNDINKKNMEVTIEFTKNDTSYVITRTRKSKAGAAGNTVTFLEDGKDITPDSVSNTNALIEKIIGIPYDIFVRVVAFSATLTPFLDLPVRSHYAANQTGIIEELFDLKTLSEKATLLKEKIKETELSLKTQKARVDQLKAERDRHEKQLETASSRVNNWKDSTKKEIISIKAKLKRVEKVDVDEQQKLNHEMESIVVKLKDAKTSQREIETKLTSLMRKKKKSENEITFLHSDECPYCKQKYEGNEDKLHECVTDVEEYVKDIDSHSNQLEAIDKTVGDLTEQLKEVESKITVSDVDELIDIKSKLSTYHQKLIDLNDAINPFVEPLEELENTKFDDIKMDVINDLTKLIDHQKFLLKLLTKKDSFVRKTLLNKNIPFLNLRLQQYLVDLGLPHTVEFTHEMTAKISRFGREKGFGNLSSGQRARVNLALSFAFRDVLQSRHDRVNVWMLDEVLDVGLDTVGVQNAAKMLKKKARDEGLSLFIISHRDEIDSAFDRKMTVQLEKDFSYIRNENG